MAREEPNTTPNLNIVVLYANSSSTTRANLPWPDYLSAGRRAAAAAVPGGAIDWAGGDRDNDVRHSGKGAHVGRRNGIRRGLEDDENLMAGDLADVDFGKELLTKAL